MLIGSNSQIHIFRRQKSSFLTLNELLWMLTKSNNQSNQKIVNIITYKVYTDRYTHMYIYMHWFISRPKSTPVSVLTRKVQ